MGWRLPAFRAVCEIKVAGATCGPLRCADIFSRANIARRASVSHDCAAPMPGTMGDGEDYMGEARSPKIESKPFHERLSSVGLPDRLRSSIDNSLAVFLEDDCDGITPDERSFSALLKFVSDHPRWVPPGLAINRRGDFIAVWEVPGAFRWSLEFLPSGEIECTELERSQEAGLVRRTGKGRADSIELPRQLRQSIFAE